MTEPIHLPTVCVTVAL